MKQVNAKVLENRKVAPGFYRMRLESAYLAKNAKPGQFLEVRCSDSRGILLRRPLGVHNILKKEVEILYEVIGKGTKALSGKKVDDTVDIIGPLGNGFSTIAGKKHAIFVAGGVGVAPLLALARKVAPKIPGSHAMIGAKTRAGLLCEKEFRDSGCFVMVSTEDGSKGHKGYVTDILKHLLKTIGCGSSVIYACGPHPMLKAVAHISSAMGVPCQISMEEKMACGVGVCLGCPVKTRSGGYKMVCKDGPVFDAKEIAW